MKQPPPDSELGRLFAQFPRAGRVEWIGLRPARDVPMRTVEMAEATAGKGLSGDRYGSGSGKRGITLIQAEAATLGMSNEARAVLLARLRAEQELKQQAIPIEGALGQAYLVTHVVATATFAALQWFGLRRSASRSAHPVAA